MAWNELDLAQRRWSIPRGRTKNGQPHEVPLSDAAVSILAGVPRRLGRQLLFGEAGGPFQGWSKAKASLDSRIAHAGEPVLSWHLHDIRRTVATRMAEIGVLPHVVEAVLNHISGHKAGVAGIYNRAIYSSEKNQALALWAECLGLVLMKHSLEDHMISPELNEAGIG